MYGKVLISGAGVGGCCLAWWLDRYGYEVTLVEQSPTPREGGYVIDFWGLGFEVAARMGLLAELRPHDLEIQEFQIVNAQGRKVAAINQRAIGELAGGRMMSLQRSSVASALFGAIKDRVTVRFADSVVRLLEKPNSVQARFRNGDTADFQFVVGADGLHSVVRQLMFGEDAQFERFLGYYVAAFSTKNYPHHDAHTYVTFGEPGRQIWRITLDGNTTVFLLVFANSDPLAVPVHDASAQKALLARRYEGGHWETQEMLGALQTTTDLYFDRVSQISIPHWTKGRVALIGDACACPSLLAGEGSAMAMAEAYTLAGELKNAGGDHVQAFRSYEQRLRPYVERKQKGARQFASSFVPRTAFGLLIRNITINAVSQLGLTRLLFGAQFNDKLELRHY